MPTPNPAVLRRDALAGVTTGYALRLDADTHIGPDLERMIAAQSARATPTSAR
jgi:hypothetical protein